MKFATASIIAVVSASQALAFAPIVSGPKSSSALNAALGKVTGQSALDPAVIARYDALPFPDDQILAEYVWMDAIGNTRSKTRTLPSRQG